MPNVSHSTLAGSELHEPKGIASAANNEVYVADGASSGTWRTLYTQGFEDFNDTGSSQSLTTSLWTDLQNDGAGANTNSTYRLPGNSAIWDTVNDQFDWSGAGLALGDTVDIRFDISATTTTTNDTIALRMDMAHGTGSEYNLEVMRSEFDAAGTYQMTAFYSVYMGDTATLNNPCKVSCFTNASGNSVVVNGWYIRTIPRNPVMS